MNNLNSNTANHSFFQWLTKAPTPMDLSSFCQSRFVMSIHVYTVHFPQDNKTCPTSGWVSDYSGYDVYPLQPKFSSFAPTSLFPHSLRLALHLSSLILFIWLYISLLSFSFLILFPHSLHCFHISLPSFIFMNFTSLP